MVNLVDIHIQPQLLWAAGIAWPPIVIAVVVARFSTRIAQRSGIGVDDWLTLPALLLVLGISVNLLVGVKTHGLGYPTPKSSPDAALTSSSREQTIARKLYWISMIFDLPALTFLKLSCMLFYRRIFGKGSSRLVGILMYAIDALILIWGLGFWLAFLFPCKTHWEYLWTNLVDMAKCPADLLMMHESLLISNVTMDIILFVFPIPLVLKLHISTAKKIAVLGIFFLGAMTIAMSIIRLAFTIEQSNNQYNPNADEIYISTASLYFMYIESCFATCSICLPTLSGAIKLRGVQIVVNGFSSIFSNVSGSSFRLYRSSENPSKNAERLDSTHSDVAALTPVHGYVTQSHTEAGTYSEIEMGHISAKDGITVTSTFERESRRK